MTEQIFAITALSLFSWILGIATTGSILEAYGSDEIYEKGGVFWVVVAWPVILIPIILLGLGWLVGKSFKLIFKIRFHKPEWGTNPIKIVSGFKK